MVVHLALHLDAEVAVVALAQERPRERGGLRVLGVVESSAHHLVSLQQLKGGDVQAPKHPAPVLAVLGGLLDPVQRGKLPRVAVV